jgi:hypothetical protein
MDPVELEIKLAWVGRELEEKTALVDHLRSDISAVLLQNSELAERVAKLKGAQEQLLHDKLAAERKYHDALAEKAELASENARLHIYAREAATRAENAIATSNQLRSVAEARALADELMLQGQEVRSPESTPLNSPGKIELVCKGGQDTAASLHAARLLISRLVALLHRHNVDPRKELPILTAEAAADAVSPGKHAVFAVDPRLQHELLPLVGAPVSSPAPNEHEFAVDPEAVVHSAASTEEIHPQSILPAVSHSNPFASLSSGLWSILVGDPESESPLKGIRSSPAGTVESFQPVLSLASPPPECKNAGPEE